MRRLFKHSLKIISAGVIVLTFLSYLAPYVNPALFRWLAFFGTAFPWWLLANLALLLVWGARVHRFALYHLGIILFGWQYVSGFVGFNAGKDQTPENAFVLATHNLGGIFRGIHLEDGEWSRIYAGYIRFLTDQGDPDILCLQETGLKFSRKMGEKMAYPYRFDLNRGGSSILSRYPILRGGQVPFGQPENASIWADIRIGKHIVRVYNVHLQSNKVTYDTERVLEEPNLQKEETWQEIKKVVRKVGSATQIRAGQAEKLRELLAACAHPVILCGDFNDTPNSYVYDRLSEGLNDTFRERGFGIGTTFAGAVPLLRIDYVLTDPVLKTYGCRVARGSVSDHYPVFATLGF
ncbi:MAG: endonuclease/exonuclease/phosphatase family protein [Saprospirales bacterium]|nr:endonuclease/exonuclease/phosphatase family protein [Saprospirales bacterium]MBK8922478.1 endonuclease/exonuclease/phosphatase family protein [Saprospirales bacterium]